MPSAADFLNRGQAIALTDKYVVLVQEHLGQALEMKGDAGSFTVLPPHKYNLHFTVETVAGTTTLAAVHVYPGPQPGSQQLYFLPWRQNASTSLRIPNGPGPGIFMTSMLSGCTVQVYGPANNPSICHANAASTYADAYSRNAKWAESFAPEQQHEFAETRANTIATGKIDTMLPDAGAAQCRTVRKSDYAGKLDSANLARFQRQYVARLKQSEAMTDFEVLKIGMKPKTGAFVFGLRDTTGNWEFFYQSAVEVEIEVQDKFNGTPPRRLTMESAVLGTTERFFP